MQKERCPHCQRIMMDREIGLYKGMVETLWRVYLWCLQKDKHEFERKEIRHLFRTEGDSARFGDWVMFGGLVYKKGKGSYGINKERCDAFFRGKYAVPSKIIKEARTGYLKKEDYRYVTQIKNLSDFLNNDGEFIARYRTSQPTLF